MTDKDFNKLIQTFPSREETRQEFEKVREEMVTKDDFRKVMTTLDKVLKEVLAMRQEQSMHVADHMRIDDRLKALEHSSTSV